MSGYLNIRNDRSDHNMVVITFDGSGIGENGSRERLGGTLKIDIGRTATIKMPDFMLEASEIGTKTDSEPVDQKLERQAARIKQLEAAQHNHLVAADETDNARMQELIKALTVANEERNALGHVLSHMEREFDAMLARADDDAVSNLNRTFGVEDGGDGAASRHFHNAEVKAKADMFGALQASVDEDENRKIAKAASTRSSAAQLDKDARYFGDRFRGADSTTDLSDQASTRNENFEESDGDEQNAAEARDHLQESRSGRPGAPGGMQSTAGNLDEAASPTGHQPSENVDDSHVETQERADEMLEDENTHLGTEAEGSADDQSDVPDTEEGDGDFEKEEVWHAPQLGSDATTERSDLKDRPVKMDEEDDEGAASDTAQVSGPDEGVANENRPQEKAKDAAEAAEVASEAAQETSEKAQESQEAAEGTSQEDDDEFRGNVNKLKTAQLKEVESKNDLDGEGKPNARKQALKDKYENADADEKKKLSGDVSEALGA